MVSEVSICNRALNLIGQKSITSLTEASSQAIKCNLVYADTRDLVLSEAWWNFATAEITLALINGVTTLKYSYVYSYVSDCLAIRDIYNDATFLIDTPGEYEIIDTSGGIKAVATNIELAYLKYTKIITDPNKFSKGFIEAFAHRLASQLAHQLNGSPSQADDMFKKSMIFVSEAKRLNHREGKVIPPTQTPYVNVRS